MPSEYRFTLQLRNGLHARPASMIAEVVRRFSAKVTIGKADGDSAAACVDARSVLSLVGLDAKFGEEVVIAADGADAPGALAALQVLVESRLAEADELPPVIAESAAVAASEPQVPISLRRMKVVSATGRTACAGIGTGAAVNIAACALPEAARNAKAGPAQSELRAAKEAIDWVRDDLRARAKAAGGRGGKSARLETDLLLAHSQIVDDPSLWGTVERHVRAGATAAQAVAAAAREFTAMLRAAASEYIRDRAVDVQDVCGQVLDRLTGGGMVAMRVALKEPSVVFAESLTANQLLRMDRELLKGLVLGHVGATSHTVIVAKSMRVPTLIDVAGAAGIAPEGERVVVDAGEYGAGIVITNVTPQVARHYEREGRTHDKWRARIGPMARQAAATLDGRRLEVGANASGAGEVASGMEQGADGVGLFRTEMLFLERDAPPTEQEQHEAYAAAVKAADGRPVIFRTFDIGGDKPASYLNMPAEENPFLGVRGLRLYEKHPGLLRSQLRAIVRASAAWGGGPVKIMAPMVSTPMEAAWFRERVRAVQTELAAEGVSFDKSMPIGVMIEIPAAGLAIDQLAAEVDFFSIGTNDLCQYFLAADRGDRRLATLASARQPSFLRLLKTIVDAARASGKWIGVCGEMAGDRLNLPLMLGLGVDEISVSPGDVLGLKTLVRSADAAKCRDVLDAATRCRDVAGVEELLRSVSWRRAAPERVVAAELVDVACDAASKEEAIKAAVDLLYVAGRTDRPREVEEAVWAREATYSTGLGYGFAVPHCKTDAVAAPTLAVLKLATPVDWGSMDGQVVSMVLLLAIPASDTTGAHMKVFAKLARRLMHEEFRERLGTAAAAAEVVKCLTEELGLGATP